LELLPLALLAAAVTMIGWALRTAWAVVRGGSNRTVDEDADAVLLDRLVERRETLVQLLVSTRLDREMGKIAPEDHERTAERLKKELVAVMKRVESLGGTDADMATVDSLLDTVAVPEGPSAEAWSPAALARHGGQRPQRAS
jgi:hypothetical protein